MQELIDIDSDSWVSEDTFLERDWTPLGVRFTFGEPRQSTLIDGRTVQLWSRDHVQRREAHMAVTMADGEAEALLSDPAKLRDFRADGGKADKAKASFDEIAAVFVQREVESSVTLESVDQARALASDA